MALFEWTHKEKQQPILGERRTVRKVILCKRLSGEWRLLGIERVVQEFQAWTAMVPETKGIDVCGWRDIGWES